MVRIVVILLMCNSFVFAQTDDRTGLFRGGAALSLDKMTQVDYGIFSGNGNIDLFLSDKVSFRSDVYLHLGNLKNESGINIKKNHHLLVGVNYHFLSGKAIDPYLGGQVGASLTQINDEHLIKPLILDGILAEKKASVNPTAQLNLGFNYFASKYFHFFMDASYSMQNHGSAAFPSVNLNMVRFKFGLGWNVMLKKLDKF